MPNRVKISTKTTRNENFNSFETNIGTIKDPLIVKNTVTSTTATKDNPNIKLLDVNEGITQKAQAIADDSADNTTLIEMTLQVNHETALRLYDYSLGNIPDKTKEPKKYQEYMHYKTLLEKNGMSYDNIKSWIATYEDGDVLNSAASITFDKNANYQIYGAPEQQILNNRQHFNNCGIESTLNNLIMAGKVKMDENLKDQEKVEKSFLTAVWERNLAGDDKEIGTLDKGDGGTRPDDYRDIMDYYGIKAKSYYITTKSDSFVYPKANLKELAYKISQGYGAVIGVSSDMLWKNAQSESGGKGFKIDHAVALIGVVYAEGTTPSETATPVGFFIHDTGGWMTKFISYDEFVDATLCDYVYGNPNPEDPTDKHLTSLREYDSKLGTFIDKDEVGIFVTLTDEPIKVDTLNLNATGDKYANILWGNNSNNVIKGMNGNDTLYGRGGGDTIYGGNGNDVIVGNEALDIAAKYKVNAEVKNFAFNTVTDFKQYLTNVDIGTRLDNLDSKELKPAGTFNTLLDMYKYLQANVPDGKNTLDGGAGDDIIIGGEQADLIYGGKGNDYIYGGDGRNAVYGGAGSDIIIGGYDNDRLFGDAGNDTIYGLEDEDAIDGGAGNDHLWGGGGSDMIETGKGNDTVYFEGNNFGQDDVMSKGGSTVLKFVNEGNTATASKVSDLFYTLEVNQETGKTADMHIQYKLGDIDGDESKIKFRDYYTVKSGKAKTVYVASAVDANTDDIYTVSTSIKHNAKVANAKMNGKTKINGQYVENSKINNILMTAYEGAIITTSDKNDIVTMLDNETKAISDKIDIITYTGGKDKYVSEDRNTNYNLGALDGTTNLSIYDNVIGLEKTKDKDGKEIDPIKNYTSTDDKLYTATAKAGVKLFFDVKKGANTNGYTTSNGGFYLLNSDNMKASTFTNIAKGNELDGGFVYMDSFFGAEGSEITNSTTPNFYGNGRVEHIICDESEFNYTEDVAGIAAAVAGWLKNSAYTSAYEVFASNDTTSINNLVQIYTNQGA